MKKVIILSLALALVGGVAYANFCARDVVPAATLLFPYVTVDVDLSGAPNPAGQTTITGITNVSRTAVIVHFTAWDATSVPRIDFDEILSGYDVLQINWRDFLNGRFDLFDTSATAFTATAPKTFDPFEWGPDGRGQGNTGSQLTTPQNRNVITTCGSVPPYTDRSDLASTIQGLINGVLMAYPHDGCGTTGLRGDKTGWSPTGINPTFFYVTADVVQECNLLFPTDTEYWNFGTVATSMNVLIGDVIYLNPTTNTSEMFPAVHLEASQAVPRTAVLPFYGEKTAAETYREPLGTAFAFRYGNSPADNVTSNVILWKNFHEITTDDTVDDCGSYLYYAWDMDERSLSRTTQPISGLPTGGLDYNQFPLETQKVPLTNTYFDLPDTYGWMLIVLPPSYPYGGAYTDPTTATDVSDNPYMWWAGIQFNFGSYSAGTDAATMANYWCYANQVLPQLGANPGYGLVSPFGFVSTP
jgi:hypothetical protein